MLLSVGSNQQMSALCAGTFGWSTGQVFVLPIRFCINALFLNRDVLDVRIWEYQVFVDESSQAPPTIIPFSKIVSQAARITVRKSKGSSEKLWLTIGLDKV